jgi:uncharacterized membrane protein YbhN (UPF0104 family)
MLAHDRQSDVKSGSPELPAALGGRRVARSIAQLLVLVAVVAAVVLTVPGLASIRSRLASGAPGWLVLAGGLRLASAIAYVVVFRAIFCPHLSWRVSYQIGMTENGVNAVVPAGGAGGLAVGGWVLHRDGMPTRTIVRRTTEFFIFTSTFNFVAVAVIGWLATIGVVPIHAPLPFVLVPAVAASAVIAAALVAAPRLAALRDIQGRCRPRSLKRWLTRSLVVLGSGTRGAIALFRDRDLQALVGGTAYLVFDIATLWATVRAFHGHPSIPALTMAYLVGQLAGEIPVPGGIGVIDGGLIGAMILYGLPGTVATAGVLAYHAIALAVPMLFGGVTAVSLARTVRGWSRQRVPTVAREAA